MATVFRTNLPGVWYVNLGARKTTTAKTNAYIVECATGETSRLFRFGCSIAIGQNLRVIKLLDARLPGTWVRCLGGAEAVW